MTAELVGYDPQLAGGVFTFGGTGDMLYGVKVGLEKAMPGSLHTGVRQEAVILASDRSHSCCLNVAGWLGIGQDRVLRISSQLDNSIDVTALAKAARARRLIEGRRIAAIVATMGSTDAFGIDDLQAIHACAKNWSPSSSSITAHISMPTRSSAGPGRRSTITTSIANPLGFRGRTVRALAAAHHRLRHLRLADSIGVDFHKTGYCPYISSLVLFRDRRRSEPALASPRDHALLVSIGPASSGDVHLGNQPQAPPDRWPHLANLILLGKEGFRTLLGHAVEMAEVLREQIEAHPDLVVLNGENVGPVTLFRVYPPGVDTFTIKDRERCDKSFQEQLVCFNALNRRVYQRVHADALAGRGVVLSMTDCYRTSDYGVPIAALKSYVLSPFTDEERMRSIVTRILAARDQCLQD